MTPHRARCLIYGIAVACGALATTGWYAIERGQDFNYDQLNYHIGVPFLLAHGTFWDSAAPASIQSYFVPYVVQAQFFAIQHLSAQGFAVALATLQSTAFMIAGVICADIAQATDRWRSMLPGLMGFALCVMAPVALSEAGTTFIDLLTAVPVLAAYALLLVRGRWLGSATAAAAAGALLGAATALKLTNGIFVPGVVGFALAGADSPRQRVGWLILCGVAFVVGLGAVGGSWFFTLWERFGNPFFPFYNGIFHSPDFGAVSFHDNRFLPQSVIDIWRYPVYWLRGGSPNAEPTPTSEVAFIDARWIVAICGTTSFLAALPIFRGWRRRRLMEPATGLIFAFFIDYLVWLGLFGIQRYAVVLEILCGAVILALVLPVRPYMVRAGFLAAVALFAWRVLLVPDWGHVAWAKYWRSINPETVKFGGPSLVFLSSMPSLFVAASLPADARYVGLDQYFDLRSGNDTALTRQIRTDLASAPGLELKEIDPGTIPAAAQATIESYGLRVSDRCEPLQIVYRKFRICAIERKF